MKPSRSVPIRYILPDWLHVPVLPILVATEIRAIFPAWLFAILTVAIAPLLGEGPAQIAPFGYALGCTALGSIAAGRDFMHRTVGQILSLPVSRERLWWTRLSVALAGMTILALLTGAQLHLWRQPRLSAQELIWAITIFLSPILSGLLVAPWLTLLFRSALAGAVFTISLPFLLWMSSELMATARFGYDYVSSDETGTFKAAAFGLLLLAHWVAGGVLGRGKFLRLEAIEGRVGELHLPRWLSRQSPAKSVALVPKREHALWQLVKKELRLQQMAFVTTGLFLLASLGLWEVHQLRPELDSAFIEIGTFLAAGLLAVLIGAVASAEERQLGTAEWQLLLPMAARQQWAVKVAAVLGLAVLLAAFLPAYVLHRVSWGTEFKAGWLPLAMPLARVAIILATMSLYFSSVCNNGLKAMLISLPAAVGLLVLIGKHLDTFESYDRQLSDLYSHFSHEGASLGLSALYYRFSHEGAPLPLGTWLAVGLPPLLLVGLFLLTLRFSFVNHRSAERSVGRIWRQLGCLIAYVALSAALCYSLVFLYAADDPANQEEAQSPASLTMPTTLAQIPPGMNAEMMKRYGLIPKDATVQFATKVKDGPSIQTPSTSQTQPTTSQTPTSMSIEMMRRYGLLPSSVTIPTRADSPASKE